MVSNININIYYLIPPTRLLLEIINKHRSVIMMIMFSFWLSVGAGNGDGEAGTQEAPK